MGLSGRLKQTLLQRLVNTQPRAALSHNFPVFAVSLSLNHFRPEAR